ncbi:MAG: hypothetical protein ACKOOF_11025, partial [Planctomycetaceae bacterium]
AVLLAVEQALETTEQVVLLTALLHPAAAVAGVAGGIAASLASVAGGLTASLASVAARIDATLAGVAARLTARRAAALVTEHPIEELETEGLATKGDAENQRTEEHHTLHRATSPLLVDHTSLSVSFANDVIPRL